MSEKITIDPYNAKDVVDMLISFSSMHNQKNHKDFVKILALQHRTHQQNITRLILPWLRQLGKFWSSKCMDGRNEASCEVGKLICDAEDANGEYILPYI